MFKVLLVSADLPAFENQTSVEEFERETIKEASVTYKRLVKSCKRESKKDGATRRVLLCLCGAEVSNGEASEWGAAPSGR